MRSKRNKLDNGSVNRLGSFMNWSKLAEKFIYSGIKNIYIIYLLFISPIFIVIIFRLLGYIRDRYFIFAAVPDGLIISSWLAIEIRIKYYLFFFLSKDYKFLYENMNEFFGLIEKHGFGTIFMPISALSIWLMNLYFGVFARYGWIIPWHYDIRNFYSEFYYISVMAVFLVMTPALLLMPFKEEIKRKAYHDENRLQQSKAEEE